MQRVLWLAVHWGLHQCCLEAVLGGAELPYYANIPPISVSEAAAPPIRMMACKADLCSVTFTKQLYTCKVYVGTIAINCAIVTLARIEAGLETSALDSTPRHPPISKFWREHWVGYDLLPSFRFPAPTTPTFNSSPLPPSGSI